ncbi:G-type lectin S-receptor-like serine/threonine-protein kinase [Acorus gramineus]|uniref:G-type lectin S-receptor-like serine/threonine-protein kinase n=1 Tax=Acorus gramineus TaxID=55184 RepID=A0AAV9BV35_ACOGR|nr:G-type lectin S-receptor-like serine/threonine-protein kinase [Acorus gramineus]
MAGDSITLTQPLKDGQTLISSNETFELGFFSLGNSTKRYVGIWYYKIPTHTIVWVANRDDPIVKDGGGVLRINSDGNLVIIDGGGNVVWSSKIGTNSTDSIAQIRDDGNFALTDNTGTLAWQSFDHPTDTILPGMKSGWNLHTGLNHILTSWRSTNDPSSGNYKLYMDIHGSPQLMLRRRSDSVLMFRSGPWNGLGFSGIPEMRMYNMVHYEFVQTQTEVYFITFTRRDIIPRMNLLPSGVLGRFLWVEQKQEWNQLWATTKDQCNKYGVCGPNGVCNTSDINLCDCLSGFKPKSPNEWYLKDGSDGCVRKTELDCGGDAFVEVSDVKLPDTSNSTVDKEMSLDACSEACAKNCSCTAYATANISSGRGCLMWFGDLWDIRTFANGGQVIYLRLAASEISQGNLKEDQQIAVKRLSRNSTQGLDEFKNEVVLIAKLQHRNLVRLLGCCVERNERMLIYEYMPNKSLDTFLFGNGSPSLVWRTRHDIVMGIARGLVYLHQDSRFRIIHRDLKVSNILLDKEMNPKISDFGLARIFQGNLGEANTRRVVGTYGYMSPEYAMDGVFSVKSDVFSFGVLVLEIVSGKKNRGVYQSEIHLNLLAHVSVK